MPSSANPDIIPLIKHVCLSLKSFAASKQVQLGFSKRSSTVKFEYQPLQIVKGLSDLLCRIISYLPVGSKVMVSTSVVNTQGENRLQISIHNTGINLSKVMEVTNNLKLAVSITPSVMKETTFIIQIPITKTSRELIAERPLNGNGERPPVFFEQIQKRLKGYLSRTNNYLENLTYVNPRKAAFLKKVNACIVGNLADENFDATALSKGMAMSRTQLFRKLKTVISLPPACYIKDIRLQKAKELLQTGELTVSEVAYKTGFKTPSHFTKVFTQKFGIRPSVISASDPHVTKG